jgi:hypothetical protein
MVNLEDLKKFDIKSIEPAKIVSLVLGKKELLVQVVLVGISVTILISMIGGYFSQQKQYREDAQKLNEKIDIIQSFESGNKKIKHFLSTVPKGMTEDQFSSQITDYAAQSNTVIDSFSPGPDMSNGLSSALTVQINLRAQSYKDFLMFIKSLEQAPFSLRIDSCSLSMGNTSGSLMSGSDNNSINAVIQISSVILNDK